MRGVFASCGVLLVFVIPGLLWAASPLPAPTNYVNDFAGVLNDQEEAALNQQLKDYETTTTIQIFVAVVKDLGGQDIESYAGEVFKEWKIGQKGQDNGVLILGSINDNLRRIEIGYGLEGALTDGEAGNIIRMTLKPAFQDKDYARGLSEAIGQIETEISGGGNKSPEPGKIPSSGGWVIGVYILFIFFQIVSACLRWLAQSRSYWQGGLVGGVFGLGIALVLRNLPFGFVAVLVLASFGFLLDYLLSKNYKPGTFQRHANTPIFWGWGGGGSGGGGFSGGGFGGAGGGSSGGGGASG